MHSEKKGDVDAQSYYNEVVTNMTVGQRANKLLMKYLISKIIIDISFFFCGKEMDSQKKILYQPFKLTNVWSRRTN